MKKGYVYILASGKNGTLYIGVTSNLIKRIYEHKCHPVKSFTEKYHVNKLVVYYEIFDDIYTAINREKRLKRYKREWKIALIEKDNPGWNDLYNEIV
jgi:putative endonuclease